jgi:hypothetical protein
MCFESSVFLLRARALAARRGAAGAGTVPQRGEIPLKNKGNRGIAGRPG